MQNNLIQKLKYPLWYVFKAPQRKHNKASLSKDIKGMFIYLSKRFQKKINYKISVCIGIANRNEQFLTHLLPSLNNLYDAKNIELSVYDMNSNNYEYLKSQIEKSWKGSLVINQSKDKFSRSRAFNQAVEQSTGEIVFICDADLTLPPNLSKIIKQIIRKNRVWFPICTALPPNGDTKKGKKLWWSAKGILACLKSDFYKVGKLNEKYIQWGIEDVDLWERFHKNNFMVIRQPLKGFYHNYHKPVDGGIDYFIE